MSDRRKKPGFLSRYFECAACGEKVKLPFIWITGIESVFRCPGCKKKFKTGYKTGAFLFALSLTFAITVINLMAYIFGASRVILLGLLVILLWFFFGFVLRKAWLTAKCNRAVQK